VEASHGLLDSTLAEITPADPEWRGKARARLEQLTMPHWALGRLMDLAEDLAGMTRSLSPPVARKAVVVMAGDHGVTEEGVSLYPREVTVQMVHNFVAGGAGINALARVSGSRVHVVDMGVSGDLSSLAKGGRILSRRIGAGTSNIARGPAMSREQAVACLEAGIGIARQLGDHVDVYGTGDMGIGNTTPSGAVAAAVTGEDAERVTGRGTGIDDAGLDRKIGVIRRVLEVNRPNSSDGIDVLMKVGGFEIGGIAGLILGAAALKKPVVVDGYISTAGALIAKLLAPASADYMIAAHRSAEGGHDLMQKHLQLEPLLDLGFRLGEGTGGAMAMPLLDGAVRLLGEVSTFEEAAVSGAKS
jgi:nicotinate-nucleotide--dimethylbenzimidazole phosphoribosyltransferase